ncbi:glycosyltransferase [Leptospira barantonii]|uniref:Glycosyl transferase n=1 Tax=Leptospira barantonii TaxID=2023184 RepID=A0ABX4NMY4_9LEPT|nr:glycosyltransferase [Leptospira barantonii]PJZ58179.1 glycosyl transferase [Leptospira barantonii]
MKLITLRILFKKIFYLFRQYQYFFFLYAKRSKFQKTESSFKPLISVIVPVYNTRIDHLQEMVMSVEKQTYAHWELILLDDASPKSAPGEFLRKLEKKNPKIRYSRSEKNGGISIATSKALEYAKGEYVAFLDHDDQLMDNALGIIVDSLQGEESSRPEFLYSDEIYQSKTRGVFSLSTKPDFSIEKLISHNYICHLVVVSKNLIQKMGGYREGYDGSQDHEFALRACRHTNRIRRLPFYLYEWRLHQESFSRTKAAICENSSKKAIREFYADRAEDVKEIVSGHYPFTYHPVRKLHPVSSVSIVVFDSEGILKNDCKEIFDLVSLTPEVKLEIVLSASRNQNLDYAKIRNEIQTRFAERVNLQVVETKNFNVSAKEINSIVTKTNGSYLFFWNPLFMPKDKSWLYELLQHGQSKGVGAVTPIVLNQRGELIYSSLLLGKKGFIGVAGNGLKLAEAKIWSGEFLEKNVSAISRNLFLISRDTWNSLNGLNESYQQNYWDVDLCLRILQKGFRIVSNPFADFTSSRPPKKSFQEFDPASKVGAADRRLLIREWGKALYEDRFYSPHSDLVGCDMQPKNLLHPLLDAFYRWRWDLD